MPVKPGSGIRKSWRVFGPGQQTSRMIRAGLYARVFTQDQQTLPMHKRAIREYASRRGYLHAHWVFGVSRPSAMARSGAIDSPFHAFFEVQGFELSAQNGSIAGNPRGSQAAEQR